jgi:predicted TIM-barrel fold metal-dependent hydrolase
MTSTTGKIDVHHHMVPEFYASALKKLGVDQAAGAALPDWTPEKSLALMDATGIAKAYLSVSCPGVYFGDTVHADELARQCNEFGSALKQGSDRFGFFATVSQTQADSAVAEAKHAFDVLGADGVTLLSSVDGQYLGHPDYWPLLEELNRRKAVVFVHPNLPATAGDIKLELPGYMIEFVFDTTRAVANLITSGTMERFPDIRFILSHAGGTVPYVAWRLSLCDFVLDKAGKFPQGTLHYLKQFYYDTALSPSPYMLGSVRELIGTDRLLFGSDYPFAPDLLVHVEVSELAALGLSEAESAAVGAGNARALFGE